MLVLHETFQEPIRCWDPLQESAWKESSKIREKTEVKSASDISTLKKVEVDFDTIQGLNGLNKA